MSQQPPYGQDPQQPYGQPYTPYSQGAYGGAPNPYQGYPQRRDNTTRNVLLIVGGLVLVLCLGVVGLGIWAIASIDSEFDQDFRGSENDPLTVTEGEEFSIRGFDYEQGWSFGSDEYDGTRVNDLRVTNNRDDGDAESLDLTFQLFNENELVATIDCGYTPSLDFERSLTLDCTSYGDSLPAAYDEIQVYDDSYGE